MKAFFNRAAHAAAGLPENEQHAALLATMTPPRGVTALAVVDRSGDVGIASTGNSTTALFEIGSVTKTITATALARMAIERQLSLDTKVGEILGANGAAPRT